MKILYLAEEEGFNQKHFDHFSGSLTEGQSIVIYDPDKPDEPQFEGVGFVMDPGGAFGSLLGQFSGLFSPRYIPGGKI